jgi:hypothetical protein
MLKLGDEVWYDGDKWRVAGLHMDGSQAYLERGATGDEKGAVRARTAPTASVEKLEAPKCS